MHVSKIDLFPPIIPNEESARAITPTTKDGCSINCYTDKASPTEDGIGSKSSGDSVSETEDFNITKINSLIKIKPTEKAPGEADPFTENSEDSVEQEVHVE